MRVLILLCAAAVANAQCIPLTAINQAYTQDFNTLATSGIENRALPPGWMVRETGTSARADSAYAADDGSSGTGDTYSYGAEASGERALGSLLSGSLSPSFGACFINQTAVTIRGLAIRYQGEQYRLGAAARADRLRFEISADATSLASGSWAALAALEFSSPVQSGAVGRISPPASAQIAGEASGLNIAPGATLHIRWTDTDATGADDGLAIDDLAVTPLDTAAEVPLRSISEIQGPGDTSPFNRQTVRLRGIVTARKFNGFFLQTPDEETDFDPRTSEGIFVFTSMAAPEAATPGNRIEFTGIVDEFRPATDPNSPTLTQIRDARGFEVLARGVPLPETARITEFAAEHWEGMRVRVDALAVVAPTGGRRTESTASALSNGIFWGVAAGMARPFREPGIDLLDPVPEPAPCCVPRFDGNPERIRVDSDALEGTPPADVATGAIVSGLTGPLDYGERAYTINPEPGAVIESAGLSAAIPVRDAAADEFTVAAFNLERFYNSFDDPGGDVVLQEEAYQRRLNKASLAIRTVLRSPDIITVVEVEDLATLQDLAVKINNDATAAGLESPDYTAHLVDGNDPGLIDTGFLVKTSRATVLSLIQEGKAATFINPANGAPATLFDRPPLILRAEIFDADSPVPVTVIANHFLSLLDVADPSAGPRARAKRQAQATFVARLIQDRQNANPQEAILTAGDFNAFEFNDGYVDVTGTVRGNPAPPHETVASTEDLVHPDLADAAEMLPPDQRYSFVFQGSAQTLDHILINHRLVPRLTGFEYARVNADFPEILRNDATRPERVSDHDAPVAYFSTRVH
ncbi:MAG: hypothetical protein FJW39_17445 [Acidobacteria bacterium]|nr:hypothetical protein [Acidobacteriota bacterium]